MAPCFKKRHSSQSVYDAITIYFVHKGIQPLVLSTVDGGWTCQRVLQHCLQYICSILNISTEKSNGPNYLPVFGLVACPDERIWLPRNHVFDSSSSTPRCYKFKVRFRPPPQYVDELKTKTNIMWEYQFLQILDEFLTGELSDNHKLDIKKIFTLLSYALLMPKKLPFDNKEQVSPSYKKERRMKIWQFHTYLSKSLKSRLISTIIIDHYWICESLKENTTILKSWNENLGFYKRKFYKMLIEAVPTYGTEIYEKVTRQTEAGNKTEEVTLTIGYYGENLQPALYFGEELQFILSDIDYVKFTLPKNMDNKLWTVRMELKNEKHTELHFKEEAAAKSFLSLLQGSYSLYVQYDKHLCTDIQTADSKLSSDLFSFGPLKQCSAEKYLKEPQAPLNPDKKCFLIHESRTEYNSFVLVSAVKKHQKDTDIEFDQYELRVNPSQSLTLLKGKIPLKELTLYEARTYLKQRFGMQLHPKHYHHVSEIEHVFNAGSGDIYKENCQVNESQSCGPFVYLPEELDNKRVLIRDKNPLLKKYVVSREDQKMMLVELQTEKGKIAEAFRSGIQTLIKLHKIKPESFLKFYGFVLDKKLGAILEYSQSGDLLTYICEHPQSVPQKLDIIGQIIKILFIMQEHTLFHGNIRLRRFYTFKENCQLRIKLGDSGVASYLNTEDKFHKDEMLPWLPPEIRMSPEIKTSSNVTYESACYAVGTTICEILHRTDQFHEILRLSDPEELRKYFHENQFLPEPDFRVEGHYHAKGKKLDNCLTCREVEVLEDVWYLVVMRCWAPDPIERPSVSDLRKIFSEIKVKSDELDKNSVTEGLKQVVYDAGIKDEVESPGEKVWTRTELENLLMQSYSDKYLASECLELKNKELGKGYFGVVWEGRCRQPNRNLNLKDKQGSQWTQVAVKRFFNKQNKDKNKKRSSESNFVKEVILACSLQHTNIVKVFYFSFNQTESEFCNIMLIMEFMNAGDLRCYAESKKNMADDANHNRQLLQICLDVSEGMVYLNGKDIVHRDLAARNILLAQSGGQIIGKISDFGLARKMEENYRFYRNKLHTALPFAWMPPECLDRSSDDSRFTNKGDVWSFGTMMWEAFSKGNNPREMFPKVSLNQLETVLLDKYKSGWRLSVEHYVRKDVYQVMLNCWELKPAARPAFVDLVQIIKGLLTRVTTDAHGTRLLLQQLSS